MDSKGRMNAGVEIVDRMAALSALSWWRDAGVDVAIDEAPRAWLLEKNAPAVAALPAAQADPAAPVIDTIEAYADWIETAETLPDGSVKGRRFRAEGDPAAPVMVLIDAPEAADTPPGPLLSDDSGRLFDRMLAAIGLARSSIYLVPFCFARPLGRQVDSEGLAALARRHIMLARPKRLLLLGQAVNRSLLGTELVPARGELRFVNHDGGKTAAVASFAPRFLIQNPARKADAWRDLRLLIEGLNA
jgi:uracil-DNA glycosylase family 4